MARRQKVKDIFRAADDLYNASLRVVNTISKMGLDKARPETREALPSLCQALEDYEHSRFGRRKVIIEFEAPMPSRVVARREMSRAKGRRIVGAIKLAADDHPGRKNHDGEKTKS